MKNIFGKAFTMTNNTKLAFSALEAELIQNSEWILTKQSALQKLEQLLALQVPVIEKNVPAAILAIPELCSARPKISRGEKYLDLPWLMLDYPAVFSKENVFALRTMFWWGHYFSVQLHLSGRYLDQFAEPIIQKLRTSELPLYLSVGEHEWHHHFEENNFLPIKDAIELGHLNNINELKFLKIGIHFPLTEWEQIDHFLESAYRNIFALFH